MGYTGPTDPRSVLKRILCYHRPRWTPDGYYAYECSKCGFLSDEALNGVKVRHLGWLMTGRMPKPEDKPTNAQKVGHTLRRVSEAWREVVTVVHALKPKEKP